MICPHNILPLTGTTYRLSCHCQTGRILAGQDFLEPAQLPERTKLTDKDVHDHLPSPEELKILLNPVGGGPIVECYSCNEWAHISCQVVETQNEIDDNNNYLFRCFSCTRTQKALEMVKAKALPLGRPIQHQGNRSASVTTMLSKTLGAEYFVNDYIREIIHRQLGSYDTARRRSFLVRCDPCKMGIERAPDGRYGKYQQLLEGAYDADAL